MSACSRSPVCEARRQGPAATVAALSTVRGQTLGPCLPRLREAEPASFRVRTLATSLARFSLIARSVGPVWTRAGKDGYRMFYGSRRSRATERPAANDVSMARQASLYRAYAALVRRVARTSGVCWGDVDDVVQRVFLTVFTKLDSIRAGSERAFIVAVTVREAGHVRRGYRRRAEVSEGASAPKSSGAPRLDEGLHQRRQVAAALARLRALPDVLRTVWLLHEGEGLTCEEIAKRQRAPLGTVKTWLRRARAQLRS